jgi:hypothetical protein
VSEAENLLSFNNAFTASRVNYAFVWGENKTNPGYKKNFTETFYFK